MDTIKLIILGSGCAGNTAAIYAARASLSPIVLTGTEVGGQLVLTTLVENFPGFPQGINGFELIDNMRQQAEKFGAKYITERAVKVDFSKRPFYILTEANHEFLAESVIIATGARAKTLNIPGEKKFFGHGVSTCATCDAAFYRKKKVVVIGGGDTALEDSLFLTRFADEVHLIHRRNALRASQILQTRALNNPKITVHWNTEVVEILGNEYIEAVKLLSHPDGNPTTKKDAKEEIFSCDGVFLAIGHQPNVEFLENQIMQTKDGFLLPKRVESVNDDVESNIEGVFLAGDVANSQFQQAITAAAMGCKAALQAISFLNNQSEKL